MSTHQVSKPRAAKKSIAEESARPGTCRSKVGCEAMEEPCTNRMRPAGPAGSPACLFHRKSFTSAPLPVQCSVPAIRNCSFMDPDPPCSLRLDGIRLDDFGPFLDLGLHVGAELGGRHCNWNGALLLPRLVDIRAH